MIYLTAYAIMTAVFALIVLTLYAEARSFIDECDRVNRWIARMTQGTAKSRMRATLDELDALLNKDGRVRIPSSHGLSR